MAWQGRNPATVDNDPAQCSNMIDFQAWVSSVVRSPSDLVEALSSINPSR